jgi:hypothetical protein
MKTTFVLAASFTFAVAAHACDLCGTTLIQHPWDPRTGFTLGASEQFTRMKTLLDNGQKIDNDADQKLDSSITQIYLGYHITPHFGVQVNVPLIRRTFRRATEAGLENGSTQGLGDVSVTANWLAIDHRAGDFTFQLGVNAGVKFPTGDSDRVKEEGAEGHTHGEADAGAEDGEHHHEEAEGLAERGPLHARHEAGEASAEAGEAEHAEAHEEPAPLPDGIHGHDLALGTGSVDLIVGGTLNVRWKRLFFETDVQYAVRGDGEHSYDFANDFSWSGGPGVTLIDRETHSLSVQFVCSGEDKGEDEFRGVRADDTSITQVFMGPKISGTWRDRFAAEVELDIPIHQDNTGVQIVPDYRIRAAVSWSF